MSAELVDLAQVQQQQYVDPRYLQYNNGMQQSQPWGKSSSFGNFGTIFNPYQPNQYTPGSVPFLSGMDMGAAGGLIQMGANALGHGASNYLQGHGFQMGPIGQGYNYMNQLQTMQRASDISDMRQFGWDMDKQRIRSVVHATNWLTSDGGLSYDERQRAVDEATNRQMGVAERGINNSVVSGFLQQIMPGGSGTQMATMAYDAVRMQNMSNFGRMSSSDTAALKDQLGNIFNGFTGRNSADSTGIEDVGFTRGFTMGDFGSMAQALGSMGKLDFNKGDAASMKNQLKDMAGALSAVREMVGDPDAPAVELIKTLQQITGGALGRMDLKGLEGRLRESRNIGTMMNLSPEQTSALMGATASSLEGKGLPPWMAMQVTNNALLSASAAASLSADRDANGLAAGQGKGAYAQAFEASREQMIQRGTNLQTTALGSGAMRRIGMLLSMNADGIKDPAVKAAVLEAQASGSLDRLSPGALETLRVAATTNWDSTQRSLVGGGGFSDMHAMTEALAGDNTTAALHKYGVQGIAMDIAASDSRANTLSRMRNRYGDNKNIASLVGALYAGSGTMQSSVSTIEAFAAKNGMQAGELLSAIGDDTLQDLAHFSDGARDKARLNGSRASVVSEIEKSLAGMGVGQQATGVQGLMRNLVNQIVKSDGKNLSENTVAGFIAATTGSHSIDSLSEKTQEAVNARSGDIKKLQDETAAKQSDIATLRHNLASGKISEAEFVAGMGRQGALMSAEDRADKKSLLAAADRESAAIGQQMKSKMEPLLQAMAEVTQQIVDELGKTAKKMAARSVDDVKLNMAATAEKLGSGKLSLSDARDALQEARTHMETFGDSAGVAEIDNIISQLADEQDPEKRSQLLKQAQSRLTAAKGNTELASKYSDKILKSKTDPLNRKLEEARAELTESQGSGTKKTDDGVVVKDMPATPADKPIKLSLKRATGQESEYSGSMS